MPSRTSPNDRATSTRANARSPRIAAGAAPGRQRPAAEWPAPRDTRRFERPRTLPGVATICRSSSRSSKKTFNVSRSSSVTRPRTQARSSNKALADLQAVQASARLGYGADAILRGAGTQVAATDTVTTSALRDLQRGTEQAQALANEEAVAGQQTAPDPNAELVAQLQTLRRQLAELTQQARPEQNGKRGQQAGRARTRSAEPAEPAGSARPGSARPARVRARRMPPAATSGGQFGSRDGGDYGSGGGGRVVRSAPRRRLGSAQSRVLAEPR